MNEEQREDNNAMVFSVDLALKMIPEFNGNRENLHKFIACCDIVHPTATTRAESQQFLNVIKTKLSGSAYNLIKYKEFASWDELKIILQDQYLEKRTIAQIQTELLNSRQRHNESVRCFSNRIEKLVLDLNDACIASEGIAAANVIQNLNKKSALKAFVEGLENPIKLIVKASRFHEFQDAVEAACEEERSINSNKKSSYQNSKPAKPPVKCFKCGKMNHTASQCYTQNFPSYPNHTRIKTENVYNVQEVCRYCKNVGHSIELCRKRAFNNSKQARFQPPNSVYHAPNSSYGETNIRNNGNPNSNISNSQPNPRHNPNNNFHQGSGQPSTQNNFQPRFSGRSSGNEQGPSTSGSATRVRDIQTA